MVSISWPDLLCNANSKGQGSASFEKFPFKSSMIPHDYMDMVM